MDRLFVANKAPSMGSNKFLSNIKHRYNNKKAGFSGILDPFACGCLIVAFGKYTKLFPYISKTPKTYKAVLCLGLTSDTLDIEGESFFHKIEPINANKIQSGLDNLLNITEQTPPAFSAKRVNGKRAYELARKGESVALKSVNIKVEKILLTHYFHPFITFEVVVSEGTYIRSLGETLAKSLNTTGTLTYLERICEGKFSYENEKPLNPLDYLTVSKNTYTKPANFANGQKLTLENFTNQNHGIYYIIHDNHFSIIEITPEKVRYKLLNVPMFD